ncbi:MAG TPA: MMPL family transporter, partial [Acidothermaceae bacterium]
MFERLGGAVYTRRGVVLLVGLAVIVLAGLWGGSVTKRLSAGGYYNPNSESVLAANDIKDKLHVPSSDATVLFTSASQPVTDPQVAAAIENALASLPRSVVPGYLSYATSKQPQLISTDRHATYATLQLAGDTDSSQTASFQTVKSLLAKANLPGVTIDYAGLVPLNKEISGQVSKDLKRAEALSLPI